jgi:hypothetical protein
MMEHKRSRDCIDTVIYAEVDARQFVLDMLAHSYDIHAATHEIEAEFFNGAENVGDMPDPTYLQRVLNYWLHFDLLPAPVDKLVFSNKYEIGVLQSKPLRCPRPLPTDGTALMQAKMKKGKV